MSQEDDFKKALEDEIQRRFDDKRQFQWAEFGALMILIGSGLFVIWALYEIWRLL